MQPADGQPRSQARLRPWRRLAAALAMLQMLGLLGLSFVLFIAGSSAKALGYALAGAISLLEVGQWLVSRAALRRAPTFDQNKRFASVPRGVQQQRLVELNLALSLIALVCLSLVIPSPSFGHEKFIVFVLLEIAFVPGWLSLWRVRRQHSWLAVSRIPSNPRRQRSP